MISCRFVDKLASMHDQVLLVARRNLSSLSVNLSQGVRKVLSGLLMLFLFTLLHLTVPDLTLGRTDDVLLELGRALASHLRMTDLDVSSSKSTTAGTAGAALIITRSRSVGRLGSNTVRLALILLLHCGGSLISLGLRHVVNRREMLLIKARSLLLVIELGHILMVLRGCHRLSRNRRMTL